MFCDMSMTGLFFLLKILHHRAKSVLSTTEYYWSTTEGMSTTGGMHITAILCREMMYLQPHTVKAVDVLCFSGATAPSVFRFVLFKF